MGGSPTFWFANCDLNIVWGIQIELEFLMPDSLTLKEKANGIILKQNEWRKKGFEKWEIKFPICCTMHFDDTFSA
jgi:hypothetical protein